MAKFKIGDRVTYVSGWDDETIVPCAVCKIQTSAEVHPFDARGHETEPFFYEILADDGHITVLAESELSLDPGFGSDGSW